MRAKLRENRNISKQPAVMMEGIEGFWHNDEKWVRIERQFMRFTEAPTKIQNLFAEGFRSDDYSRNYMKKHMGITGSHEQFDQWFKCVLGGLDNIPDISADGNLVPDAYNNLCTDTSCPHRGKFCSVRTGLKNYEIETIMALEDGRTFEQAAHDLFLSRPGLNSRVEKIREKLGAANTPQLIAKAARLGIL